MRVLGFIMAGGEGSRLAPLTAEQAKPAVSFAGKYRIVDFVLSNFVNSGDVAVHRGCRIEEAVINEEVEVGEGAQIRRAILDKGAVIPPGVRIGFAEETDRRHYHVSGTGIIIVPATPAGGVKNVPPLDMDQDTRGSHHLLWTTERTR